MSKGITLPYQFEYWTRPYQVGVFGDERRNKVLAIHRRAGKTSLGLNKIIMEAARIENSGEIFHYVFPTKTQAKEVVWKDPNMLFRYLPKELIEKRNEVELTVFLKNKAQIYIKGADDPDSLRGSGPKGVILDEYAQMKPEVYMEIYRPIIAAKGGSWIWFMGTPKGKNDFWNKFEYAKMHEKEWQWLELRASQSNIIPIEQLRLARKEMPEALYNQEFECAFLAGSGTIFRRVKENIKGKLKEAEQGIEYKAGLDLAKYEDFTVMTVVNRSTMEVVAIERYNQIDYNLQKARIEAMARRYNNCRITVDRSSIGSPICEDLRARGLYIDEFTFTNETKKALIESLAVKLEQDEVLLPPHEELIRELENYTYTLNPTNGRVYYNAPAGQHDDCVIALALAFWKIGDKLKMGEKVQAHYGFHQQRGLRSDGGYRKQIFQHK